MNRPSFAWMLATFMLCSCGEPASHDDKPSEVAAIAAEQATMGQPAAALEELDRRMRAMVQIRQGVLVVKAPESAMYVTDILPLATPWSMRCGVGVVITFGTSISGGPDGYGSDVLVRLSPVFFDEQACSLIGPELGHRLQVLIEAGKTG